MQKNKLHFEQNDRKRSSSFHDSLRKKGQADCLVIKKGCLKKKGLLFYNNRLLTLTAGGLLTYSDPKILNQVKGSIDLNDMHTIVKFTGKQREQLEILTKDQTFIFRVRIFYSHSRRSTRTAMKWESGKTK